MSCPATATASCSPRTTCSRRVTAPRVWTSTPATTSGRWVRRRAPAQHQWLGPPWPRAVWPRAAPSTSAARSPRARSSRCALRRCSGKREAAPLARAARAQQPLALARALVCMCLPPGTRARQSPTCLAHARARVRGAARACRRRADLPRAAQARRGEQVQLDVDHVHHLDDLEAADLGDDLLRRHCAARPDLRGRGGPGPRGAPHRDAG